MVTFVALYLDLTTTHTTRLNWPERFVSCSAHARLEKPSRAFGLDFSQINGIWQTIHFPNSRESSRSASLTSGLDWLLFIRTTFAPEHENETGPAASVLRSLWVVLCWFWIQDLPVVGLVDFRHSRQSPSVLLRGIRRLPGGSGGSVSAAQAAQDRFSTSSLICHRPVRFVLLRLSWVYSCQF